MITIWCGVTMRRQLTRQGWLAISNIMMLTEVSCQRTVNVNVKGGNTWCTTRRQTVRLPGPKDLRQFAVAMLAMAKCI